MQQGDSADFSRLGSDLLLNATSLLYDWLPSGKIVGSEFECGNLSGVPGRSLRINIRTGKWADFSADIKGGDLISLYAAIKGIKQIEAYRELGGTSPSSSVNSGNGRDHSPPPMREIASLVEPPGRCPSFKHKRHGDPVDVWDYTDSVGRLLYHIARYFTPEGKQFIPWSYRADGKWVNKAWPEPRPLYGLHNLAANPGRAVLIVEGEKAADAAQLIVGDVYAVVTWQGGTQAFKKTDFTPIHGRKILMWPDADNSHVAKADNQAREAGVKIGDVLPYAYQPGPLAMRALAETLLPSVSEIKMLNVSDVVVDGWDAADAVLEGMSWAEFKTWAPGRASRIIMPVMQPPGATPPSPKPVSADATNDGPLSLHVVWESIGLSMTKNGGPSINANNVVKILNSWEPLKGVLWFDEFHQRILTTRDGSRREWRDVDDIDLMVYIQDKLGLPKMSLTVVQNAVALSAWNNRRNEAKDWMESLVWDKSPRIDHFFEQGFGATESEYISAASRNWWIGMAARIYQPGCKFDNMVVLEGKQGKLKSTALDLIGGQWFMEATETLGHKDFLQSLSGKLLVEIAELDSFSKADIRTIKKTISCRVDTYRSSYGRRSQDYPRQCVFVGTTNEDEYLEDSTGGRRFWPVKIGRVDLNLIKEHREQLFAEAVYRFKAGENWWVMPKTAHSEQESRRRVDAWEDVVSMWLSGREDRQRLSDIAEGALGVKPGDFDKRSQLRLGAVMRSLGWDRRTEWQGTRAEKRWSRGSDASSLSSGSSVGQRSIFEQSRNIRNEAPGAVN